MELYKLVGKVCDHLLYTAYVKLKITTVGQESHNTGVVTVTGMSASTKLDLTDC